MLRTVIWSSLLVLVFLILFAMAQKLLGRTLLSEDPAAVLGFLSSLAQFAAIPITIAFGVIVLIIQQQANTFTGRAGALVVGSPGFFFVVALLFEVPILCVVTLGMLDPGEESVGLSTRQWAGAAIGPVVLTLIALAIFTWRWFGRVSPADFGLFVLQRARRGARFGNRNTASLAVRGLGDMINNLALSTDDTSLRLCMNYLGVFLVEYVGNYKPRLVNTRPGFFRYHHPIQGTNLTWVESEACTAVRNAVNTLMARMGPSESIYHLVDWLLSFGQNKTFGQRAMEVGDTEALKVLARTFVDMGTTEATFASVANFNIRPLERSADGAIWAHNNGHPEAERLLSATFFVLFTYLHYHIQRLTAGGWVYTSKLHETKAKELKNLGIDFSKAAKESRERFEGYWIIRFQDPDAEQNKALKSIERL